MILLLVLACCNSASGPRAAPPAAEPAAAPPSAPPAEPIPMRPPIDPGFSPGNFEGQAAITATGAGPYQVGMPGAAALALPGAAKADPTCSCAYDVRFPLPGVTLGVGLDEKVCQVWITGSMLRSAAGLGVGAPLAQFTQAYGETRTEEATGMLLFANAPWLAVQAEGDAVQALRVGACPE